MATSSPAHATDEVANQESVVRRFLRRVGTSESEFEAAELKESSRLQGATAADCCECGQIVTVVGLLRSVTLRPVAGVPSVEAELYDGSGRVTLIWLGRRRIVGIEPGLTLSATGRVNLTDDRRTIFNPRYTLRPHSGGE